MTDNKKQNAFVFYICVLVYVVLAAVLRVIALAPLACLFVTEGAMRFLALLCPVLLVCVILPLRYSFAQAMARKPRRFSIAAAFSFADYGAKLKAALIHALHVAKWGIPLAAMLGYAVYAFRTVEYLDLYNAVKDMGDACVMALSEASAWLNGLLGTEVFEMTANNFMAGVAALGVLAGLGVLILLCGVMRNSASRYIWAAAVAEGKSPRAEIRSQLKKRRIRQLGVAMVNLILWAPFLCVIGGALKSTVSDLSTVMMMALATHSLPSDMLLEAAAPCAVAFGVLYLPLLPLRRWNTAAFALRVRDSKSNKKVSA